MAIDFTKLTPVEEPTIETQGQSSIGIDFSKLTPIDSTEDTADIVEAPIEIPTDYIGKLSYNIDKEIDLKKTRIEEAKKQNPDMTDLYDGAMLRLEKDREDKKLDIQKKYLDKLKTEEMIADKEKYSFEARAKGNTELLARGAARPALGILKVAENMLDSSGMSDEKEYITNFISDNEEKINEIIKQKKEDGTLARDSEFNYDNVGEILISLLPISKINTLGSMFMTEAAIGGLTEYGKGSTAGQSVVEGVEQGLTASALKIVSDPVVGFIKGLSSEAKTIANRLELSDEELATMLKDVPMKDQARVLSEQSGPRGEGWLKQALTYSDKVKKRYSDEVNKRTSLVTEAIRKDDFDTVKALSKGSWKDMERIADEYNINVESSDMVRNITIGERLVKEEKAKAVFKQAQNLIETNDGNLSLPQLLKMEVDINEALRGVKGNSIAPLMELKSSIAKKIEDNTPSELNKLIGSTKDLYIKTKQQEKLIELVEKNTKTIGDGSGEFKIDVINYPKLLNKIEEAGLDTPIVKESLEVLKKLSKQYNNDLAVFRSLSNKGSSKEASALTVYSGIVGKLKEKLWKFGEFGEDMNIQQSINKSILNSNTSYGAIESLISNKKLSNEIIETLIPNIEDINKLKTTEAIKIQEALIERGMGDLGMGKSYGGKATIPKSSTVGNNDYSSSLYGTKKEQEALVKVVDRYGIEGTNKANTTSYENGAKEWYSSLTNKQKEEVVSIVEAKKDRTGGYNLTDVYEQQIKSYGKNKDGSPSYNDISESLFGTQKKTKDTSGNLGMTSNYGEKATGTGGVNTKEAKDYLNRFMDDIANPKVTVDTNKINDLYGALKSEGTTMYGATTAKEKAWEDAMDIVNKMRNKNSVTPKEREQMIQAVKKYHSLINSTI